MTQSGIRTPRLKSQLVVMTRSGNIAIVEKYIDGQTPLLSGIIYNINWTWNLNGRSSNKKYKNNNDIVSIVGDFD